MGGLLDDFGDLELVEDGFGGVAEGLGLDEARAGFVGADDVVAGEGVGGGFDAGEIAFGEGVHVVEDTVELGGVVGGFVVGEFETGEFGDAVDVDGVSGHGQGLSDRRGVICQWQGEILEFGLSLAGVGV